MLEIVIEILGRTTNGCDGKTTRFDDNCISMFIQNNNKSHFLIHFNTFRSWRTLSLIIHFITNPLRWATTLSWWRGLCGFRILRALLVGISNPW